MLAGLSRGLASIAASAAALGQKQPLSSLAPDRLLSGVKQTFTMRMIGDVSSANSEWLLSPIADIQIARNRCISGAANGQKQPFTVLPTSTVGENILALSTRIMNTTPSAN